MPRTVRPDRRHVEEAVRFVARVASTFPDRLTAQLARDARGGSAVPDGYPTSTIGTGGGERVIVVTDEHGEPDFVPVTAIEAAAIRRLELAADEHRRLTWAAWERLQDVVEDVRLVDGWLARLEAATTVVANAANDGTWCENHLRHAKGCEPVWRRQLCRWCYDVQAGFGELPNAALLDRHGRGERLSEGQLAAALGARRVPRSPA